MCDTMVAIVDGRVLFGKSSDRDPNEAQALTWQAAASHPAGATLRCTYLAIPQARETHAVLLSRPFWMWGAEIAASEHGVIVGNEAVFTRQPYAATGLTGMDLVRLAAERATSAAAAVALIGELLETHGQGGGCGHEHRRFTYHNSFLVADRAGAFVVETAGRRWQAERVSGAWSISNALTLPAMMGERDRLRTRVAEADTRRACTLAAARAAREPAEVMRALRDHGARAGVAEDAVSGAEAGDHRPAAPVDGPPRYRWWNGAMSGPCAHAGGVVASTQTVGSWVAELSPGGDRHWVTATAAPCLSPYKPVRIAEPLDLGPAPSDRADDASLWWRHERMHRRAIGDRAVAVAIAAERDAIEARWRADPPAPRDAFAEADRALVRWTELAAGARDRRPPLVRRYWRIRDARAGLAQR